MDIADEQNELEDASSAVEKQIGMTMIEAEKKNLGDSELHVPSIESETLKSRYLQPQQNQQSVFTTVPLACAGTLNLLKIL